MPLSLRMERMRWPLVLALTLAVGCSGDPVPQDGIVSIPWGPETTAGIEPASFMAAAGCRPLQGRADSGTIAIPVRGAKTIVLNCAGVPVQLVNRARASYYRAMVASIRGAHSATGYWEYNWEYSREWCYGDGSWGEDGRFHLVEGAELWGCFFVDYYSRRWVSWGDPGYEEGGEGGNPDPGDPEPQPPALVSVTVAPSTATVDVGEHKGGFIATAKYADSTSRIVTDTAVWSVPGGNSVIAPDDPGSFMAVARGEATLRATYGGMFGSVSVVVRDTICLGASGETLPNLAVTPMGDLSLQQTFWNLTDAARNSSSKNERGGVVLKRPGGTFYFLEIPGDSGTDPCNYYPATGYPYVPSNPSDTVFAYLHTHPMVGDTLMCPSRSSGPVVAQPGPSGPDLESATVRDALGYAKYTYIIDPTGAYRVDGKGANAGAILGKAWTRATSPTACAIP